MNISHKISKLSAVAAVISILGLAVPMSVSADAATLAAGITVNGSRSSTLAYGSIATLAWNTAGFDECLVTPGNWTGTTGSQTLQNVTVKQTYKLACTGVAGTATAYTTFAVAPPTFDYLRSSLASTTQNTDVKKAQVRDVTQKIKEAESHHKHGQDKKAKALLDHTVTKINKLAGKDKLSLDAAHNYEVVVNALTASWSAPQVSPDPIPNDVVVPAVVTKPANGGYPDKWANIAQDSVIDSWGMYNRECVSYTAFRVHDDFLAGRDTHDMPYWGGQGSANQWDDNARAADIPVDTTPTVGSIAISNAGYYGFAMYVEQVGTVNGQPAIYTSQYNQQLDGNYSEGWRSTAGLVFIHF